MRILAVAGRPPWPQRRGDQLRAAQLVAALASEHEVTLLAPAGRDEPALPDVRRVAYRRDAAGWLAAPARLLRGWPVQALPFHQRDLARRLRALAPEHDLVVLQLVRLEPHLRDVGGTPVVADLIDCLSLNVETRAAVAPSWQRAALRLEARRVAAAERRLIAGASRALVVCGRDLRALARAAPELADRLAVVPVAMPPARDAVSAAPPPTDAPPSVAISGNLGYFPNRDAVDWWLREVWPPLVHAIPGLRLLVAGDRPPAALRRRVERAGGTLVSGPPDLRAVLAEATVAVAPVRCGSGIPLKVLDAWSVGVPVVASPFAVEGADGIPERDLLAAEGVDGWSHQVRRLLRDPALRARLAAGGRERIAALGSERVRGELLRQVAGAAADRVALRGA